MLKEKLNQLAAYADLYNIHDSEIDVIEELRAPKDYIDSRIRARIKGQNENLRILGVLGCNPHSTGARPYKGGLRFHPNVTRELLEVLALDMTEKCALARLPFGGAKFGMAIDPGVCTTEELRDITEKITLCLLDQKKLAPDKYVPGPDMGTNSQTMFWIYNKAAELNNAYNLPNIAAVVTGKPIENDGCPGREDATSRGLMFLLNEYRRLKKSKPQVTVAIQGFGNVGMNLAKLTVEPNSEFTSYKIVAVSDVNGGLYNPLGLNIRDVHAHYENCKTFKDYPAAKATQIANAELLTLAVDILIPAAIENQITEKNAPHVKAPLIAEAGNETVTPVAQQYFEDWGIDFIPGIMGNPGGAIGSYLEWSRNRGPRRHFVNTLEDTIWMREELRKIMKNIITAVYGRSEALKRPFAESAHVLALESLQKMLITKHSARKWQ